MCREPLARGLLAALDLLRDAVGHRPVSYTHLFTYREKLAKDAVVFIPVGALEQHGSHMAMCVDAALTKAMAGATAEALVADTDGAMEAVVAAPINYGYRSQQRSGGGLDVYKRQV